MNKFLVLLLVLPLVTQAQIRVQDKKTVSYNGIARDGSIGTNHLNAQTYGLLTGGEHNVVAYGADPTGAADSATAIKAAIAAASGGVVLFPSGTYLVGSAITVTNTQSWKASAPGTVTLTFTATNATAIAVSGPALTLLAAVPQSVSSGATGLSFDRDVSGLSGLIVVRDSASGSFNAARTYYYSGEIIDIASATGTNIFSKSRMFDLYTASATFSAYSFSPISFSMEGIDCSFGANVIGLSLSYVRDYQLVGCKFRGGTTSTVELSQYGYRGTIERCSFSMTSPAASAQYGLVVSGAQELIVNNCFGESTRHAFASGGSSIPNRNMLITGSMWKLLTEAAGTAAVDCHGNAEWVTFSNNETDGALLAGDNISFVGNTVNGSGYGVAIREQLGSSFRVEGNNIATTFTNPRTNWASGITHEYGANGAFTKRGGTMLVARNTITVNETNVSPAVYLYYHSGFTNGPSTTVRVEQNILKLATQRTQGIYVASYSASPFKQLAIEGNTLFNGGVELYHGSHIIVRRNSIYNALGKGVFMRNTSSTDTNQVATIDFNLIEGCGYAAVSVNGDTTTKFGVVVVANNWMSRNSMVNQGSSGEEMSIRIDNATTAHIRNNTALLDGDNQTGSYYLANTVANSYVFGNIWGTAPPYNNAISQLSGSADWSATSGDSLILNKPTDGTWRIILPSATNGLTAGMLWNNAGTVSVMP